jgi:hypothetical protein
MAERCSVFFWLARFTACECGGFAVWRYKATEANFRIRFRECGGFAVFEREGLRVEARWMI